MKLQAVGLQRNACCDLFQPFCFRCFWRAQCGQTNVPLDSISANQSLAGHVPWTVGVFHTHDGGDISVSAGVLVRENVVLTGRCLT